MREVSDATKTQPTGDSPSEQIALLNRIRQSQEGDSGPFFEKLREYYQAEDLIPYVVIPEIIRLHLLDVNPEAAAAICHCVAAGHVAASAADMRYAAAVALRGSEVVTLAFLGQLAGNRADLFGDNLYYRVAKRLTQLGTGDALARAAGLVFTFTLIDRENPLTDVALFDKEWGRLDAALRWLRKGSRLGHKECILGYARAVLEYFEYKPGITRAQWRREVERAAAVIIDEINAANVLGADALMRMHHSKIIQVVSVDEYFDTVRLCLNFVPADERWVILRIELLLKWGLNYAYRRDIRDVTVVRHMLEEAYELSDRVHNEEYRAGMLARIGEAYVHREWFDEALPILRKGVQFHGSGCAAWLGYLLLRKPSQEERLEGVDWLRQGVVNGEVEAEYHLGKLFLYGEPGLVIQNVSEGVRLLERAFSKGHQYAALDLGNVFLDGAVVMPDIDFARYYLSEARRLDPSLDVEVQVLLDECQIEGRQRKAERWWQLPN